MSRWSEEIARLLAPQQNRCHLCRRRLYCEGSCLCEKCIGAIDECMLSPVDSVLHFDPWFTSLSAYEYIDEPKSLVHLLKFQHDASAAGPLSLGMLQMMAMLQWQNEADLIIPVPLHSRRLAERGFNQSTLLAEPIAHYFDLPLSEDALLRTRYTGSQRKRTAKERATALSNAFSADTAQVMGKRILLVDDVLTTGSTGKACAEALLEGRAQSVRMITACVVSTII